MRAIPGTIGDPAATPEWSTHPSAPPVRVHDRRDNGDRRAPANTPATAQERGEEVVLTLSLEDALHLLNLTTLVNDQSAGEVVVSAYVALEVAKANARRKAGA